MDFLLGGISQHYAGLICDCTENVCSQFPSLRQRIGCLLCGGNQHQSADNQRVEFYDGGASPHPWGPQFWLAPMTCQLAGTLATSAEDEMAVPPAPMNDATVASLVFRQRMSLRPSALKSPSAATLHGAPSRVRNVEDAIAAPLALVSDTTVSPLEFRHKMSLRASPLKSPTPATDQAAGGRFTTKALEAIAVPPAFISDITVSPVDRLLQRMSALPSLLKSPTPTSDQGAGSVTIKTELEMAPPLTRETTVFPLPSRPECRSCLKENRLNKSDFHLLAEFVDRDEIDAEITQALDLIVDASKRAKPKG